jgi:hypothetical protein
MQGPLLSTWPPRARLSPLPFPFAVGVSEDRGGDNKRERVELPGLSRRLLEEVGLVRASRRCEGGSRYSCSHLPKDPGIVHNASFAGSGSRRRETVNSQIGRYGISPLRLV